MRFTQALTLLLAAERTRSFGVEHRRRRRCSITTAFVPAKSTVVLHGILDEINSDSYDLLSASKHSEKQVNMADAYEMLLADLVFSTNDPRVDIMNQYDLACDPPFIEWLEHDKIGKSNDPEERIALKDLLDIIKDIKTRVEVNKLAEERAAAEKQQALDEAASTPQDDDNASREMSTADILKKAKQIETQSSDANLEQQEQKRKSFYDTELTPEIRLSYEQALQKVLPPYQGGDTVASVVFNHYDQFDAQFVKVLNERVTNGDADAAQVLAALAVEQQKRIQVATATLKSVLALGEPMKMEGAIVRLAREGKIDEPFLLLVEANMTQAKDAGAHGPAQLMQRLLQRAADEKDKQSSSKEIRLIRKLLRAADAAARETILQDAFTPKAVLLVPGTTENAQKALDGEAPDQEQALPEVPPPDFINACKAVLLNFGNLAYDGGDRGDLASRIKMIANEAEVVATRIYGKGMTLREHQDRVWSEQTTSIFDLERMEIEAERLGEQAPWTNPNMDDNSFIPGFDADGRMQVGGS